MHAQNVWKRIFNSIMKLEKFVKANPQNPHVRDLLTSIGTHQWQVTRELFVEGMRAEWKPGDLNLRAFCWHLFGGPLTTKQSLESCFNSLKDHGRESKANKMALQTRFSYASINPFCSSGGIPIVMTDMQDFAALATNFAKLSEVQSLHMFTGSRNAKLPDECPSRRYLQDLFTKFSFSVDYVYF